MTTLILTVKVPEIYQQELIDTKSGIIFTVNVTETNLDFSEKLVEHFFTHNYNVLSNVLQPDFKKQFSTQVTVNPISNSPVLAINAIALSNIENNGILGSSKTSSLVIDKNNVIVMGEFIRDGYLKPCKTCIDTSNSCAMYAKTSSYDSVQFLFSLKKISETFYLVLEEYMGTVNCNATIANLNKLKNIPLGPDNCSSTLDCYEGSNSFKKLSQYVNNLNTCLANNIDNPEKNCFDISGIVNAISCAKCLTKNSSCGVPSCCGSICNSNIDCVNKDCTSCVDDKCTQKSLPACGSICTSNIDCVNKDCTSCVDEKCTQKSLPACGSICSSNDGCTGATGSCTSCVDEKCTQKSLPACGSICSSNDGCTGATGGCTSCIDEKCEKSKQSNVLKVSIYISILLAAVLAFFAFIYTYYI